MITTPMQDLIEKVTSARKVLNDSQTDLLIWCRDKSVPLDERYPVWVKFVDKIEHPYISRIGSKMLCAIIDKLVQDRDWIERHSTVSYDEVIDWIDGDEDTFETILGVIKKQVVENRDKKIESVLESKAGNNSIIIFPDTEEEMIAFMKEEIISSNFGEFTLDW